MVVKGGKAQENGKSEFMGCIRTKYSPSSVPNLDGSHCKICSRTPYKVHMLVFEDNRQ